MAAELQYEDIPLKDIFADHHFNCRGGEAITDIDVFQLAKSIEKKGLIHPVTVYKFTPEEQEKYGKIWRLLSGFRRFTAYAELGRDTIPAIIKPWMSEVDATFFNLSENLERKDLDIIQEARTVLRLRNMGLKLLDIAARVDKSYSWVQVRDYLNELPQDIQNEAAAGMLTNKQIVALRNLPTEEEQFAMMRKIKDARIRGEDTKMSLATPKKHTQVKRIRKRPEMIQLLEYIYDTFDPNLSTRVLAWCIGEISDGELFQSLKDWAHANGYTKYEPPTVSLAAVMEEGTKKEERVVKEPV